MEEKKSKKADLESKKTLFLEIGLVFTLAFVLLAFNYKSYDRTEASSMQRVVDNTPEDIIPITKQEVKPPPPPPPRQVTVINIVEDNVEVDTDLEIDMEADQSTEIQDYAPIENMARKEEEIVEMEIFTVVESMPSFPGGDAARMKFLQENIKYPQMARESGIQGTVYVTFVVEPSGNVSDVRVLRGIGGGCDEEAVRVIQSMPKWEAGKQRGKSVRVQFNMPIKFTLQG
jgi:protein TonB